MALLVGAIRTITELNSDPLIILQNEPAAHWPGRALMLPAWLCASLLQAGTGRQAGGQITATRKRPSLVPAKSFCRNFRI